MAKMNYNRSVHRISDERKQEMKNIAKKPLGDEPVIYEKMTFGKYKGFTLRAVPANYLEWLISVTPEDNIAMKYAKELAKRPEYVKKLKIKID